MAQKDGFTLVEVLITLGIIGVIAAMTIPGLISKYNKQRVEVNLKETYSILQQTLQHVSNDDIAFDPVIKEYEVKAWFEKYIAPYMKYLRVCYDAAGCWQTKGPTKNLNGNNAYAQRTNIGIGSGIATVRLYNGANLCMDSYSRSDAKTFHGINATGEVLIIFIDANGDTGPNVVGQDIYALAFTENGLIPSGSMVSNTEIDNNCSTSSTAANAGYYCLTKLKNNGWVIPDDIWNKK